MHFLWKSTLKKLMQCTFKKKIIVSAGGSSSELIKREHNANDQNNCVYAECRIRSQNLDISRVSGYDKKQNPLNITFRGFLSFKSGWQDSNLRPPAPKAGAIPGYATPRKNGITF